MPRKQAATNNSVSARVVEIKSQSLRRALGHVLQRTGQ